MNPNFIAGIETIYSDEILYATGIHPSTPLPHLNDPRLRALYKTMRTVLRKATRLGRVPESSGRQHLEENSGMRGFA